MINIAIIGFGVVGSGVAEVISMNNDFYAERLCGESLNVKYIVDIRSFPESPYADRVISDVNIALNDPEVMIVVETMGGSHPAYEFTKAALIAGKSVVTSNKEVVANFGTELLGIAKENNVSYLFEASVGGGVPIIHPLWQCLAANKIEAVYGILNGTTNYILTRMFKEKASFDTALNEAQKLGYAEKNPTADVSGLDALRKICILSSIAYGKEISTEKALCDGMTDIDNTDVAFAEAMGYSVKFIGKSEKVGDKVYCIVAPFFVPVNNPLAGVEDVYNGITVKGNIVGDVMFYGRGAGKLPTASAVLSDVLDIARNCNKFIGWSKSDEDIVVDALDCEICAFVRTTSSLDEIFEIFPEACVCKLDGFNGFITPCEVERTLKTKIEALENAKWIRIL